MMSSEARMIWWSIFLGLLVVITECCDSYSGPSFWAENIGFWEGLAHAGFLCAFVVLLIYCPVMQTIVLIILSVAAYDRLTKKQKD
ncbi:MAG: hypothetical protein K8T26_19660 [Lentisphaerae bacterium]|nr:hypothetical protein [Lentisphaerota bacterium]